METYFTAVRDNFPGRYYMRKDKFTTAPHQAAMMHRDVAERICKRYGLRLEENSGYQINYASFADLGEEEAPAMLEVAVRTAVKDGLDKAQIRKLVNDAMKA